MPDLLPLRLLLATFAGWINRQQAQVIDYLVEENRVLKEQLRGRRLRLTDDQRRRLAAKGKHLGRLLHRRGWTGRGLVTHYVLFAIHHATRSVHIAGITPNPDGAFMAQVARTVTDSVAGFLRGKRYLIVDLDSKYSGQFKQILHDAGVKLVRTGARLRT